MLRQSSMQCKLSLTNICPDMNAPVGYLIETITPFSAPSKRVLDTTEWFDKLHENTVQSPIDEFRVNLSEINRLYLQAEVRKEYTPVLGSVVYLGMVSAAEGYFRSLLRRLIRVDPVCEHNASSRSVSYGAAIHHELDLLPEALLEGQSLASKKNVASELRTLCSISNMGKDGAVPPALQQLFDNFETICQVRHCGIHRFGKLGSQQALKLGMDLHKSLLEKPLKLSVSHLQDIAEAIDALIRAINSYCFSDILKRTHNASPAGGDKVSLYRVSWQLDWVEDENRFMKYYEIFASQGGPQASPPPKALYDDFLIYVKSLGSKRGKANSPSNEKKGG